MTGPPAIEIENLTVVFENTAGGGVTALRDVSLTVPQGEILAISGGNGSGKSTLLKALAGSVAPRGGTIRLMGRDVTHLAPHRRANYLSLVHQDPLLGTCPNLTLQENLQLVSPLHWWSVRLRDLAWHQDHWALLSRFGLPLNRRAFAELNRFSGGQRQAISFCMALSSGRQILLFDEFTSALDEPAKEVAFSLLDEYHRASHSTVLLVTHSDSVADNLANRRMEMKDGRIVSICAISGVS